MLWRALSERRLLIARYCGPRWERDVGISSDNLLRYALTDEINPRDYPRDHGDLGRCERLYAAAPRHLQRKMKPILDEWRDAVWEKYPEPPRRPR